MAETAAAAAADCLRAAIATAGGWLPFDEFVNIALHHPQCGYYGGGIVRFGDGGDFHTAPTMSPLFGEAVAAQIAATLREVGGGVLELGGGDGDLAGQILSTLARDGAAPPYTLLETSATLRRRQQEYLRRFPNVRWADGLPAAHDGVILANEVLDCVPFRLFRKLGGEWRERGVAVAAGAFIWEDRPPTDSVWQRLADMPLPDGYKTEISPRAEALVAALVSRLRRGCLLLADYGFGRREYYHPQRMTGTLMCHRRHRADANPLVDVGEKDITAHIDFTAIAEAGIAAGGELSGYTTQAHFLINNGILDLLSQTTAATAAQANRAAAVHRLLAPHEMGELFKWIAFRKGAPPLAAFADGDRRQDL